MEELQSFLGWSLERGGWEAWTAFGNQGHLSIIIQRRDGDEQMEKIAVETEKVLW